MDYALSISIYFNKNKREKTNFLFSELQLTKKMLNESKVIYHKLQEFSYGNVANFFYIKGLIE